MDQPSLPRTFQGITHLGVPVRVFSPVRNAVVYLALPVVFLGLGGLFWRLEATGAGPLPLWLWLGLGGYLVGMVVLAILWLWRLMWCVAYEQGFACTRRGQVTASRWDEVTAVRLMPIRHRCTHRVQLATGDEITFRGNPDQAGKAAREGSCAMRRERLADALDRGGPVGFGALIIGRTEGIRDGERVIAWPEVKRLRVRAGMLTMSHRDDSFLRASGRNWLLSEVENPDALLDLAREMGVDASRGSVTELPRKPGGQESG